MNKKITMPYGFFIAIEGIDGSGKTTLANKLGEKLSNDYKVFVTKEPSDSEYGKQLREAFEKERLSVSDELDLFIKDRELHTENTIKPLLKDGYIVITDRYYFSNIAYQGAYGISVEKIKAMNKKFPLPDLVLYLILDIDTALKRIDIARGNTNKVETKQNILKVKSIYDTLEKEYNNIFKQVDTNKPEKDVLKQAFDTIIEAIKIKYSE